MTRPSNWYPPEIYRKLLDLGHENNLSYQEVAFMLLREALASFGFMCNHSNVGWPEKIKNMSDKERKERNKPYCKDCYSRLNIEQSIGSFKGRTIREAAFSPKETFVDIKRKENAKKLEAETEARIKGEVDARIKALDSAVSDTNTKKETFENRDLVQ